MERVLCVDSVQVAILESKPPQFAVMANGKVPSTGWTRPELSMWFYVVPPEDGIQDFDFVAEPPSGIVLPVVTPTRAIHGTTGARASRSKASASTRARTLWRPRRTSRRA